MKSRYLLIPVAAIYIATSSGCTNNRVVSLLHGTSAKRDYIDSCNAVIENFKKETEEDCNNFSNYDLSIKGSLRATKELLRDMKCKKNLFADVESAYTALKNRCAKQLVTSELEEAISCISEPPSLVKLCNNDTTSCDSDKHMITEFRDCSLGKGILNNYSPTSFSNCHLLANEIEYSISNSESWKVDLSKELLEKAFKTADKKCINGSFDDVSEDYDGPSTRGRVVKEYRSELKPKFDAAKMRMKNIMKTQSR